MNVAGEAFAVKHHFPAQLVFGAEVPVFLRRHGRRRGRSLNFRERAVLCENRERLEKT